VGYCSLSLWGCVSPNPQPHWQSPSSPSATTWPYPPVRWDLQCHEGSSGNRQQQTEEFGYPDDRQVSGRGSTTVLVPHFAVGGFPNFDYRLLYGLYPSGICSMRRAKTTFRTFTTWKSILLTAENSSQVPARAEHDVTRVCWESGTCKWCLYLNTWTNKVLWFRLESWIPTAWDDF